MAADAGPARAAVWIGGSVQGVGMRWWVSREADRLGLVGSVENLWDGRVLVDAQGRAEDVDRLVELVTSRPGPAGRPGRVVTTLVERRPPDPTLVRFDVR